MSILTKIRDINRRRRAKRHAEVYSLIGKSVTTSELAMTARELSSKREAEQHEARSGWDLDDTHERTYQIGKQHPGISGVLLAKQALSEFNIPGPVTYRYIGMHRYAGASPNFIKDGHIIVQAEFRSLSSVRHQVDIPIVVKDSKMLHPGVVIHNGGVRIMAQNTFDDIAGTGDFKVSAPDRKNMYSTPADNSQRSQKTPIVQSGVFGQDRRWADKQAQGQVKRGAVQAALRGFSRDAADPVAYPGGKDTAHLDPAERPDGYGYGQEVKLTKDVSVRDRGGVSYTLASGTKGIVMRDMAGDGAEYYVDFPTEGLKAVIKNKYLG